MFKRLIVPLDGSELAERALPYAVRLATVSKGELVLVRVALAPPPATLDGADWEPRQRDAISEAEAYLSGVAEKLATRTSVKGSVLYGHASQQLVEFIGQCGADAVVMATHGRTGPRHLVYGSVAEAVLAESPLPVLLVHARPGQLPPAPFDPVTARALVPLDGSAFSETAIDTATDLVGPAGEVTLACVVEPPDHVERDENGHVLAYLDQQEEAQAREAHAYLTNVATQVHACHPGARVTQDVRLGDAVSGIVMAAVDRSADLVVMATHGRTGLRRAVLGSVAGGVLRKGTVPVMLVGPHEAHRAVDMVRAEA